MVEDIVEEILVRFPANSLARCKLLSKDCHNFISHNPAFRQKYLRRNKGCSVMLGFFCSKRYPYEQPDQVHFLPTSTRGRRKSRNTTLPSDESLTFLGHHDEIHIVAASNGFLLCCSQQGSYRRSYSICNPMNNQRLHLPPHSVESFSVAHGFVCHSASPRIDMVDYYKIVRAICPTRLQDKTNVRIEIFSSDTPVWKLICLVCPRPFLFNLGYPSTVLIEKDLIYFPGMAPTERYNECGVVIYDERKESLELLLYPPTESGKVCVDWFGKSDGAILYARHELWQLKVWMLNRQETANGHRWEWSLKHNVHLEVTVETHPEMVEVSFALEPFMFIAFHPSNPNKIFLDNFKKKVLVYDLESSKLEINFSMSEQGLGVYAPLSY